MSKLINIPNFTITSLPGGGGDWPVGILRDSFQASNERRTLREDRTADAPAVVTIDTSETKYNSPSGGLNNLTDADFNRLLAEIQVPSFTKDQLPAGQRFVVSIEGRQSGGAWNPVATVTIEGTDENTEPTTIQYRPSVGSLVDDLRASVSRVGGTGNKKAELELRVFYAADQVRQVRYITGHILVTTESTTNSAFEQFIGQDFVTDPIFYYGRLTGSGRVGRTYGGAWVIIRIDVDDNQDSTSLVRLSMEQVGDWRDV
jgi:hypothetical protein